MPGDPASAAPATGLRRVGLPCALLVLLGLFAYANSLRGGFVFDDVRQIVDNPHVRSVVPFLPGGGGMPGVPNRPVGYLTFALNYRLGGLDPVGYHAVNLAIHLANALLVFWLALLFFRAPRVARSGLSPVPVAFVAAALFATHPLGSQAVTYVVQRLTSLATLFYLLAVALYLAWRLAPRDRGGTRTASYAAFLASAFLAYRTKEIAFTLPAVLVLVEVLLLEPAGWRRFLPIAPAAALALVIPAMLLRGTAPSGAGAAILDDAARSQSTLSRLDYLRTQVVVVADYVRLLAFPSGQNLDPDVPVRHSFLEPAVLAAGAFLAALALAGLLLAARSRRPGPASLDPSARVASLGIGWFFVTVSVESSIVPIADLMYEHRAYLPSVGLFLALSVALNGVAHRLAPRSGGRVAALAGLALALVLASATLARNVVWQDELALWADTAAKSPAKFRPWFNLGTVLSVRGQHGAAATALERALAIDPGHAEARAQLGATLLQAGRLPEAETQLRAALAARPDDPEVLFNLGTLLVRTGSRDEGRALLRRYLEVAPAGQAQGRRAASALLSR